MTDLRDIDNGDPIFLISWDSAIAVNKFYLKGILNTFKLSHFLSSSVKGYFCSKPLVFTGPHSCIALNDHICNFQQKISQSLWLSSIFPFLEVGVIERISLPLNTVGTFPSLREHFIDVVCSYPHLIVASLPVFPDILTGFLALK